MNFLDGPHILAMGLSGNNVWRRACSLLQRSAFTYSCPLQPALGYMCHVNERVCAEEHHVWERYPEVRSGLLVFVDCFSCPLDCDYSEGRAILRLSHHIPCTHQDRLGGPALTRQPGPSVAFMTSADFLLRLCVCPSRAKLWLGSMSFALWPPGWLMELLYLVSCRLPGEGDGNMMDFTLDLKASAWKLCVTSACVSLDKGCHMAPFKLKEWGKFIVLSSLKEENQKYWLMAWMTVTPPWQAN